MPARSGGAVKKYSGLYAEVVACCTSGMCKSSETDTSCIWAPIQSIEFPEWNLTTARGAVRPKARARARAHWLACLL